MNYNILGMCFVIVDKKQSYKNCSMVVADQGIVFNLSCMCKSELFPSLINN